MENVSFKEVHGLALMPDHLHFLVELGAQRKLQDIVRLFKGRMTPVLRPVGLHWQQGFYDRRLRQNDSIGTVLRYMKLNPYRKLLLPMEEVWPFWYCSENAAKWMSDLGEDEAPLPEWL